MNILFICQEGRCRSKTAVALLHGKNGIHARHAGIYPRAEVPLSPYLLEWADEIICMEQHHRTFIQATFSGYPDLNFETLDIPDDYAYMSQDLIELLNSHPTIRRISAESQSSVALTDKIPKESSKTKGWWWPFRRNNNGR